MVVRDSQFLLLFTLPQLWGRDEGPRDTSLKMSRNVCPLEEGEVLGRAG